MYYCSVVVWTLQFKQKSLQGSRFSHKRKLIVGNEDGKYPMPWRVYTLIKTAFVNIILESAESYCLFEVYLQGKLFYMKVEIKPQLYKFYGEDASAIQELHHQGRHFDPTQNSGIVFRGWTERNSGIRMQNHFGKFLQSVIQHFS